MLFDAAQIRRGNWRVLFAVADSLGHRVEARNVAKALSSIFDGEDPAILLLRNIRSIFGEVRKDRLTTEALVTALRDFGDGHWSGWTGINNDKTPDALTQGEMASMLRPFRIKPQTIRLDGDTTRRGFYEKDFGDAWNSYCPADAAPKLRVI